MEAIELVSASYDLIRGGELGIARFLDHIERLGKMEATRDLE